MNLQVGDTLTVNGSPTAGSGVGYMSLDIYGPNVQTIGQPLCSDDDNFSAFSETCVIPATGTYLLVSNAGSGQFTPTVSAPGGGSGRAAGQCSSSAAPSAPAGITQYTNSQLCQSLGGNQYWAMNLQVGETLSVNGAPIPSSGSAGYMSLNIYGPNVQTIGQPLCSDDANFSAFSETCVIPATGTYLLVSNAGSGRFTPRVDHPLLAALQRAYSHWSPSGHGSVVRVHASSPRAASVCVLIVAGWRTPSRRLSCGHPHLVVLAMGRHVFAHAGSARIAIRFTTRARRLLSARRSHKLTLITIYAQRGHPTAVADTHVKFRPR